MRLLLTKPGLSILALLLFGQIACHDEEVARSADAGASAAVVVEAPPVDESTDAGVGHTAGVANAAGERSKIPAGVFVAGSTPGDRGRDPVLEPALLDVRLDAFEIDRLPYPNDPTQPPLTGVTRERARALCAQRQGRLCNELEWERACKGPAGTPYAGANRWDAVCSRAPQTCASGFGTLAMAGAMREWTASDVEAIKKLQPRAAAIRGAPAQAADVDHRCAHRGAVDASAEAGDLGFRCCYGNPNRALISSPEWLGTFRKWKMPPSRLQQMFGAIPELAVLSAEEPKYFREQAARETVVRRAETRGYDAGVSDENREMATAPLMWNPVPGEEILLVTGQAGQDAFIAAFHKLPGDRYRVGAAMTLKDETGPIVLVYNPYVRRKLNWTTCWRCYGEVGNITYREENRVVITQQ